MKKPELEKCLQNIWHDINDFYSHHGEMPNTIYMSHSMYSIICDTHNRYCIYKVSENTADHGVTILFGIKVKIVEGDGFTWAVACERQIILEE